MKFRVDIQHIVRARFNMIILSSRNSTIINTCCNAQWM